MNIDAQQDYNDAREHLRMIRKSIAPRYLYLFPAWQHRLANTLFIAFTKPKKNWGVSA